MRVALISFVLVHLLASVLSANPEFASSVGALRLSFCLNKPVANVTATNALQQAFSDELVTEFTLILNITNRVGQLPGQLFVQSVGSCMGSMLFTNVNFVIFALPPLPANTTLPRAAIDLVVVMDTLQAQIADQTSVLWRSPVLSLLLPFTGMFNQGMLNQFIMSGRVELVQCADGLFRLACDGLTLAEMQARAANTAADAVLNTITTPVLIGIVMVSVGFLAFASYFQLCCFNHRQDSQNSLMLHIYESAAAEREVQAMRPRLSNSIPWNEQSKLDETHNVSTLSSAAPPQLRMRKSPIALKLDIRSPPVVTSSASPIELRAPTSMHLTLPKSPAKPTDSPTSITLFNGMKVPRRK